MAVWKGTSSGLLAQCASRIHPNGTIVALRTTAHHGSTSIWDSKIGTRIQDVLCPIRMCRQCKASPSPPRCFEFNAPCPGMSAQGSSTRIQQMARGSPWAHHTTIHGVSGLQRIWTWDIQLLHMVNHISYEGHTNGVSKSLTLLPREVTAGPPNLHNVCLKGRFFCLLSNSRRRTPPPLMLCSHPLHCAGHRRKFWAAAPDAVRRAGRGALGAGLASRSRSPSFSLPPFSCLYAPSRVLLGGYIGGSEP